MARTPEEPWPASTSALGAVSVDAENRRCVARLWHPTEHICAASRATAMHLWAVARAAVSGSDLYRPKSLARAQLHQHSFWHSLRGRCCRRCGSLAPPPLPRPCTAMPRGRSSSTGYNMPDRHSFDAWLFICTCRPLSSAVGTCGARSSLQDISSRALCLAARDLVEPWAIYG